MKRSLKEPFGKAGLTVAILALVLAMVGGAYAAGGLTKSQEKQVTKIAKKYAGKAGATGPTGPAGAAGATGPAGPAGAAGKNGKEGPEGKEGSPWTAGGTLPSGQTEKGAFSVSGVAEFDPSLFGARVLFAPISFSIPLPAPLAGAAVHLLQESPNCNSVSEEPEKKECEEAIETEAEVRENDCKNSTAANPKAEPGNLCAFVTDAVNLNPELSTSRILSAGEIAPGAGIAGAVLALKPRPDRPIPGLEHLEEEPMFVWGSWAVTAP